MKKILFFHPDLRGGGAEKVLVDLLNKLDTNQFDITLFTIFKEGVNRKNLSEKIRQRWFFKSVFRGYSVLQRFIPPTLLYRLFIRESYDVVVAYLEGVPTRIVSGCTDPKTRKIAWVHTKIDDIGINSVFNGIEGMKACYQKFEQVICVSTVSRNTLISYLGIPENKVRVIYNALDVDSVLQKSLEPLPMEYSAKVPNLITVGRLNPQKGFDRLLEVCRRLKQDGIQFVLRIVGAGEQQTTLQTFIDSNNLADCVQLVGFHSNPYPFIRHSDLFVCSSRVEGYSTAVSESIILEIPVITTDCSGMDEILDNGKYGVIVPNDTDQLYEGLKKLLQSDWELAQWKVKAQQRSLFFKEANHVKEVELLLNGKND